MAKSDLYGRPGQNQHAFCLAVGREYPYVVRVLANVRPDAYWMDTIPLSSAMPSTTGT